MKALTVRQPWATLLADPTLPKWIETRSRRTNIRGRIGIIAGKNRPVSLYHAGMTAGTHLDGSFSLRVDVDRLVPLPLGYLIGTVDLYDSVPIVGDDTFHGDDHFTAGHDELTYAVSTVEGWELLDVTDQLPYGDFTPGRWADLTRDAVLLDEPIPMRGAQHWQEVDL